MGATRRLTCDIGFTTAQILPYPPSPRNKKIMGLESVEASEDVIGDLNVGASLRDDHACTPPYPRDPHDDKDVEDGHGEDRGDAKDEHLGDVECAEERLVLLEHGADVELGETVDEEGVVGRDEHGDQGKQGGATAAGTPGSTHLRQDQSGVISNQMKSNLWKSLFHRERQT